MRDTVEDTAAAGAAERIRAAAADLARHRGGPCLLFASGSLVHRDVLASARRSGAYAATTST